MSSDTPGTPPPVPVFLERHGYRRRRQMDAARLLPLLGVVLFAVPLLWPAPDAAELTADPENAVRMSSAITYIFLIWAGLIAAVLLLGFGARHWAQSDGANRPGQS